MKSLNIMIKPASSLCNLRCKYCFYADVSQKRELSCTGLMKKELADKLIENTFCCLSDGDAVSFVFQGGEPLLAGLDFFRRFTDEVRQTKKRIRVTYAIHTNGTLLDDCWCEFFKKNNYLVGISWDILNNCHNDARVDADQKGTAARVYEGIRQLKAHKVEFNVLCTLTSAVARHPAKVWDIIKKEDIEYVQFTPCMGELDCEVSPYSLDPKRFASFYIQLFELWFADYSIGKYRSIKLFDDCVNLMMYGHPSSCGMNGVCTPQLVIESDGTAYPCDFFCLDEYQLGNIAENTPLELISSPNMEKFEKEPRKLPKLCTDCPYKRFCGSNCKRMQPYICVSQNGILCGYRQFLDKCGPTLAYLAKKHKPQ